MSPRPAADLAFQCGRARLWLDPHLVEAARPRCRLERFESGASGAFDLFVGRIAQPEGLLIQGSNGPGIRVLVEGDRIRAHVPDNPWSVESLLRFVWLVATVRQGGLLMHGCALGWQDRGIAAIGISTAGKSTLAALSAATPGNATLLTDEIVQLFPDGVCFGTPFRSSVDNVGQPGPVKLKSLLLLTKGPHEALEPVDPAAALAELMPQLFWFETGEGSLGEQKRRLLALVDTVGVHRLTFRKDPAVGPFLRDWVSRP